MCVLGSVLEKYNDMDKCKDLKVWQRPVDPATETYQVTREFPTEERYARAIQLRPSAVFVSFGRITVKSSGKQGHFNK